MCQLLQRGASPVGLLHKVEVATRVRLSTGHVTQGHMKGETVREGGTPWTTGLSSVAVLSLWVVIPLGADGPFHRVA